MSLSEYELSEEHMRALFLSGSEGAVREARQAHWDAFMAGQRLSRETAEAAVHARLDHRGSWGMRYARIDTALRAVLHECSDVLIQGSGRVDDVRDLVVNEDVLALIERFNFLRNSGVCSPTTRSLLDEAERLLTNGWADTHGKA